MDDAAALIKGYLKTSRTPLPEDRTSSDVVKVMKLLLKKSQPPPLVLLKRFLSIEF